LDTFTNQIDEKFELLYTKQHNRTRHVCSLNTFFVQLNANSEMGLHWRLGHNKVPCRLICSAADYFTRFCKCVVMH